LRNDDALPFGERFRRAASCDAHDDNYDDYDDNHEDHHRHRAHPSNHALDVIALDQLGLWKGVAGQSPRGAERRERWLQVSPPATNLNEPCFTR
jgi:hypothetical protein